MEHGDNIQVSLVHKSGSKDFLPDAKAKPVASKIISLNPCNLPYLKGYKAHLDLSVVRLDLKNGKAELSFTLTDLSYLAASDLYNKFTPLSEEAKGI